MWGRGGGEPVRGMVEVDHDVGSAGVDRGGDCDTECEIGDSAESDT